MVPVDHPEYRGFELTRTESVKTPKLRRVVENLRRSDIDASFDSYQVIFYTHDHVPSPSTRAELILAPKVNRARLAHGPDCIGIEADSAEEAVRKWLDESVVES